MSAPWPRDPRELARVILAQPRYRGAFDDGFAGEPWPVRVVRWLAALWGRITAPLPHLHGGGRLVEVLGYAILAGAALLLLAVVVSFARRSFAQRRAATVRTPAAARAERDLDSAALRERALLAAAGGRRREAARLLWRSALRGLDEAGHVRYDEVRTPGEWRRAYRDPEFDALARDAVVALYDAPDPDDGAVTRMRDARDRLVSR